ncbi:signal recognition particle 9 kDa protein-domain-containing protein [Aspergillus pseudoustus]|uniref:Signal recognition particle 9 kDa protein-domain-containing protein n=1 Tax=Aspergillus pseudoustus TaxID=1810923 RepID=A0ABR4JF96_9EURO
MPSSPYLPTSAAFLKESSLLLQAYPDSTLITTKYTFPSSKPSSKSSKPSTKSDSTATATTPLATLVLKTYNPVSGICLKYKTNKAAEVGRLITALGLLAGGADISLLDVAVPAAGTAGGEEDGAVVTPTTGGAAASMGAGSNTGAGVSKGKGKGKGKKGKK